MAISIRPITTKEEWEPFVLSHTPSTFLQSWNWGAFSAALGEKVFPIGVFEDNRLAGVALVTKTEARRGSFLVCPGGPLLNCERLELLREFTEYLGRLAKQEKAWFVRVRPWLLETPAYCEQFRRLGFRDAPTHLHAETTLELDVSRPEEQILSGMRKTTRNLIRRAARDGVSVRQSRSSEDVDILYELQAETVRRHGFVPFPLNYLKRQFCAFEPDDEVCLFLAEYQGQVIAAAMIMFYGDTAVYHYGASSTAFDRIPASYLVQWEAIKEAKSRGCRIYNFWGIAKDERQDHPWAGLSLFKRGFGGERVDYLHAQDCPISPMYWITYAIETARRKRRRL